MARVVAEVVYIELEGDYATIDSVGAACTRCEYRSEAFGRSEASIKRCLATLRDECPRGEYNYYIVGEA